MRRRKPLSKPQVRFDCRLQTYRHDEPPGDSAGRFAVIWQRENRDSQRAGFAPPHAAGDELSGMTSDRESFAFISGPIGCVGGVPLTRARNPWAMPVASR